MFCALRKKPDLGFRPLCGVSRHKALGSAGGFQLWAPPFWRLGSNDFLSHVSQSSEETSIVLSSPGQQQLQARA